jgi:hypothetical protein
MHARPPYHAAILRPLNESAEKGQSEARAIRKRKQAKQVSERRSGG